MMTDKQIIRTVVSNRETLEPVLAAIEDCLAKGVKPVVTVTIKKEQKTH